MKIDNVNVYGLENSIRASKFPKSVDLSKCSADVTDTVVKLAQSPAGTGHNNFLKGIIVQFDLTCTIKMWTEAERYHWFDIVSSQSTMHKIANMDYCEQTNQYVTFEAIENLKTLQRKYAETKDKEDYLALLYNVPTGLELTAGITTNYLQLKTIYWQRKDHRLPEWREFCEWCETLPMFKEFMGIAANE